MAVQHPLEPLLSGINHLQHEAAKRLPEPMQTLLITLLVLLGLLTVLRTLMASLTGIWVYFLRPGKNLRRLGKWAVVTGATDGIGRAYCNELAQRGLNIMLLARSESRLQTAALQLKEKFPGVEIQQVVMDFSQEGGWDSVKAALDDLDVGVLVNNVGVSYDHPDYLPAVDDKLLHDLVAVNVMATTKMTQLVLPGMQRRRRGAIVNISSAAGTLLPTSPLLSVYAGTKAYIDMFTRSLAVELRASGITVQNQAPLFVATKLAKIRNARLDAPSPAAWARSAVQHIGYETVSCPYPVHGLMWAVCHRLPQAWLDSYVLSLHLGLRKRYYKKQERLAKAQ